MLLGIGTWSGGDQAQNCWHRGNGVSSAPHHPKGECRRKKMGECRRKNEECRKGSGSRSAGCFHSTFCILHSAFCILHFHSWGEREWRCPLNCCSSALFSVGGRTLWAAQQRWPAAPSPPAEGGEGRGEEGRANPTEVPSPQPSPRPTGRGRRHAALPAIA